MKHTADKLFLSLSAVFLFVILFNTVSQAEDAKSFSISPPNFEINANPSDAVKNTIKLNNLSDKDISITVKGENFVPYGDEGRVNLTDEDSTYSINKWLTFSKSEFTIEAHKTYLFDFTIQVPKNAEPGSHYGAVVFASGSANSAQGTGASIIQEIGALVLIKIPGEVTEDAKLISFVPETTYFTNPKVKFNSLVENSGGVHFKMSSNINIYDIFGNKVKTLEADPHNILPGSQRVFNSESDFDNFGYFRADVEFIYANGAKILRSQTNFFAFNLTKSIPIAVTAITLFALYLIFHKRINKAIKIIIKG